MWCVGWLSRWMFDFNKSRFFMPNFIITLDGTSEENRILPPEFSEKIKLINIPGHSKGSIALFTTDDEQLFCGDLLENVKKPKLSDIMDDLPAARQSLDCLRKLKPRIVYPGHGSPFELNQVQE
mmetsp:Transcript_5263/g.6057  ORF Transcript_5263/g.6057 Transcript_5263/m.6057 type:complete len:124 (+) Transcript_5263:2-373(+)